MTKYLTYGSIESVPGLPDLADYGDYLCVHLHASDCYTSNDVSLSIDTELSCIIIRDQL